MTDWQLGIRLRVALQDGPAPFRDFARGARDFPFTNPTAVSNFDQLEDGAELMSDGDRSEGGKLVWKALRSTHVRGLRIADDGQRTRRLMRWVETNSRSFPKGPLENLSIPQMAELASLYRELRARVKVGPTSAAKILWAFAPNAAIPNDARMRAELGFADSETGYFGYLYFAWGAIRNLARSGNMKPSELAAAVSRPKVSTSRLLDEFLYRAEVAKD